MRKYCSFCGRELPAKRTKRRLYCSATCRKRAQRAREKEMRAVEAWLEELASSMETAVSGA